MRDVAFDKEQRQRQYWLWVTRPEYYLEEDGREREDMEPALNNDTEGWWTCHKDTRRGDLILLWRSIIKKDVGYLIQAASDAYCISEDGYAAERGWDFGCDYQVLHKFSPTMTIQAMKNDTALREWSPLRQSFRKRVFHITPEDWTKINRFACTIQPDYRAVIDRIEQEPVYARILLEEQLEEALAHQLSLLRPFGYDLELYRDPQSGASGRQFVCKGNGGRIDLLCYDSRRQQFVVIELKNVRAGQNAFGQVASYVGYVQNKIANGKHVIGLVISRGQDARFEAALHSTDRIVHLNLSQLGFE